MANTKQAQKRAKQAEASRKHNMAQRSKMRTLVKKVRAAIAAGQKDTAAAEYTAATSILDNYARKGLIHANAAARIKSRLSAQIKAL